MSDARDEGEASEEGEAPQQERRPPLAWVVTPIVGLVIAAYIGDALTTTWADRHPLWLTMLNARNRILVLTTNQLDPVTFYVVAGLRLLAADPLFYLLGRWYGDAMVVWVEKRSSTFGEQIRLYERAFAKAAYPIVFIAPNTYICLFAGASGMPVGGFLAANIAGTILRLYLIRRVGEAFDEPIQAVLRFFANYRLPLFVFSVALVTFIIWSDRRKGGDEITTMLDLAEHPPDEPDPQPDSKPPDSKPPDSKPPDS